jgi:hypothetical protein
MLNVTLYRAFYVTLSVVMLNAIVMNVIMLSFTMPIGIMLNVHNLSIIL